MEKDKLENKPQNKKNEMTSSRARNRTVMLTPEITGQVRTFITGNDKSSDSTEKPLAPNNGWNTPGAVESEKTISGKRPTAEITPDEIQDALSNIDNDKSSEEFKEETFDPFSSVVPSMQYDMPNSFSKSGMSKNAPDSFLKPKTHIEKAHSEKTHGEKSYGDNQNSQFTDNAKSVRQERHHTKEVEVPSFNKNNPNRPSVESLIESIPTVAAKTQIAPTKPLIGFLVSFDNNPNGEVVEIREGRWLVSSKVTDQAEYIVIEDQSISPLHAILRASNNGKIQILDQLSEHGTGITKVGTSEEREISGSLESIEQGDLLRLGKRKFWVCCLPKVAFVKGGF